nr:hypothetical protein [Vibrio vulnificus]
MKVPCGRLVYAALTP